MGDDNRDPLSRRLVDGDDIAAEPCCSQIMLHKRSCAASSMKLGSATETGLERWSLDPPASCTRALTAHMRTQVTNHIQMEGNATHALPFLLDRLPRNVVPVEPSEPEQIPARAGAPKLCWREDGGGR